MVGPVGEKKKVTANGEPTAGKAAFKAMIEQEFKAKMEEKELDSFRDVRGGASHDPGMQARQASEAGKARELDPGNVRDVAGAPPLEQKPDAKKIEALLSTLG